MKRPKVDVVADGSRWTARLEALAMLGLLRVGHRYRSLADATRQPPHDHVLLLVGEELHDLRPGLLRRLRAQRRPFAIVTRGGPSKAGVATVTAGSLDGSAAISALLAAIDVSPPPLGELIRVVGAAGAPGRTEVALALAAGLGAVVVGTAGTPDLGARTGAGPHPTVAQAAAAARTTGVPLAATPAGWSGLRIVSGFTTVGDPPADDVEDVAAAWSLAGTPVVLDGPPTEGPDPVAPAETTILVVDPGPVGLTRAALLVHRWSGRPPLVVVNRHRGEADTRSVRRWLGLEPWALVPESEDVRLAARRSRPAPIALPPLPTEGPIGEAPRPLGSPVPAPA